MLPLVGSMLCCLGDMILFKFQRGFNQSFVYLLISSFFLCHSRDHFSEALNLDHAVMKRRQFNLVVVSPPGMWAMPVQIQAESKSIPLQLIPVRWSKVFQPLGRKHLLLFEAVAVNCLIRWHEGRVLNLILLDPDFSLFLSVVPLVILPCAAQRALHTPTCSCTFFSWRYRLFHY